VEGFDAKFVLSASPTIEQGASGTEVDEHSDLSDIVARADRRGLAARIWIMRSPTTTPERSSRSLASPWQEGAQEGLSQPVDLLLEPDEEMESRRGALGYRFFTSKAKLIWYLETLLGIDIDGDDVVGEPEPT